MSASGVTPMDAEIKAIVKMPARVIVFGVRTFMGLAGYYRKLVLNFSDLAKPLNELTQANTPFEWGQRGGIPRIEERAHKRVSSKSSGL